MVKQVSTQATLYHTNSNASASAIPSGVGFEFGYIFQNTLKIGLLGTLLSSHLSNKSTSFVSSSPSIVDTPRATKVGNSFLV